MKQMKRILTLMLCLCMLLLSACKPEQPIEPSTSGSTAETENQAPENPVDEFLTIINADGTSDYRIVYSTTSSGKEYVYDFINSVETKCGVKLNFYPATTSEKAKEILIGCVNTREESKTALKNVSYTEYEISVVGDKIVVAVYEDALLGRALSYLVSALRKQDDGSWGIKKSFTSSGRKSTDYEIPIYQTTGTLTGIYQASEGNYEAYYTRTTAAEVEAYEALLKSSGYTLYTENAIGNNTFATYTKDSGAVRVAWYPAKTACRIVYGPKGYLPSTTEPTYTAVVTPTLAQLKRSVSLSEAQGLSLVTQLADGSYLIVDGGPDRGNDKDTLYNYLVANKPASHAKPRVTWMITHAHGDHMGLAIAFLSKYSNLIELETVCYSFPDFGYVEVERESVTSSINYETNFKNVISSKYPNTKTYIYHTGDKLLLPGCEIEFLLTHEDFWVEGFGCINETCAAWKMTVAGKSLLVLGDCDTPNCNWLADVYGNEMKSDILQATHHGYNGGTLKLYQLVAPTVCLWPAHAEYLTDTTVNPYAKRDYNQYLYDNVDRHYTISEDAILVYPDLTLKEN